MRFLYFPIYTYLIGQYKVKIMEKNSLLHQDSLWLRLQEFSLDRPNVDFPFSKKLAKEENWTLDFTQKVIEEYKKFVYLCCRLDNGASPSEIVDKVWHMHLLYTQNYWEEFCPHVLRQNLHHHPSTGGDIAKKEHEKWFSDTLAGYREIFKQEPPKNIWIKETNGRRKTMIGKLGLIFLSTPILLLSSCWGEVMNRLTAMFMWGTSFFFLVGIVMLILNSIVPKDPKDRKGSSNNSDGGGSCTSANNCGSAGGCSSCGSCGSCGGCSS
ncbi:glycine-rich domain-containing protein [Sphingobacterium siyangense]|uniref:glycine-rich domain-containing protein n=1 Tax=Sphingobacterium siyangense TaxID=459529 RepID=UPI0031F9F640